MIVDFGVYCLGYNVGGREYSFEIEIDESELEGLSEEDRYEYIHKVCHEYLMENLEICIDFNE